MPTRDELIAEAADAAAALTAAEDDRRRVLVQWRAARERYDAANAAVLAANAAELDAAKQAAMEGR